LILLAKNSDINNNNNLFSEVNFYPLT